MGMSSKEKVEVNYRGLMLKVTGSYYKGSPGHYYARNGDPGDPPEPPEFEIEKIELNGEEITDFFDGLEHVTIIAQKRYADDCYCEIEDLCLDSIEEVEHDSED
jgi:hypothetical protein